MERVPVDQVLQDYLEYLRIELPDRIFTREWKPRERYQNSELQPGIFTLIYKGSNGRDLDDPFEGHLRLMIIGRIYCGHDASGVDVERAELQMEDEIRQFCEGNHGAALQIVNVHTSHQVEAPDGWVLLECVSGPHDLHHSTLYENGVPYGGKLMAGVAPDVGFGHEPDYLEINDGDV